VELHRGCSGRFPATHLPARSILQSLAVPGTLQLPASGLRPRSPDDREPPSPPDRSWTSLLHRFRVTRPSQTAARPPSTSRSAPLLLLSSRPTNAATGTFQCASQIAAATDLQLHSTADPVLRRLPLVAWRALLLPSRTPYPNTRLRPTSSSAAD